MTLWTRRTATLEAFADTSGETAVHSTDQPDSWHCLAARSDARGATLVDGPATNDCPHHCRPIFFSDDPTT